MEKFGGTIETYNPGTWWDLDVEVLECDETSKDVIVGICSVLNGDVIFDPQFSLSLKMHNGEILGTEIKSYLSQTVLGTCEIDENDILYGFGCKEKDEYGLRRRFSSFMDNMTENGPYLTQPKSVKKYSKTLSE